MGELFDLKEVDEKSAKFRVPPSQKVVVAFCPPFPDQQVVLTSGSQKLAVWMLADKKCPKTKGLLFGSRPVLQNLKGPVTVERLDPKIPSCPQLRLDWQGQRPPPPQLEAYLKAALQSAVVRDGEFFYLLVRGQLHGFPLKTFPEGEDFYRVGPQTEIKVQGSLKEATNFAKIGGLNSVIDELRRLVQHPLENPEEYRAQGVSPPRGILFYGPPGTGKTLMARSLGASLQAPLFFVSPSDLLGEGQPEERLRQVFERAQKAAPALIFFDEIDAICPRREDCESQASKRLVSTLLSLLDSSAEEYDGLVIIGATNRPNALDSAIRRSGRFEREIEIGVPSASDRREILTKLSEAYPDSLTEAEISRLAEDCHGFVGADLAALLRRASFKKVEFGVSWAEAVGQTLKRGEVLPSCLKEYFIEIPKVKWTDIGGYDSVKAELREAVEWPVKYATQFQKLGLSASSGILLYGPPGCCKTMLAKAVATESKMNFIAIKGPEIFSKWVGDSEKKIRDIFRRAREASPCIIFFDEVDSVAVSRDSTSGVGSRVLAQLLNEMDGCMSSQGVIVIGATNRPEMIDSALMRPGRFDKIVLVRLPDSEARRQILNLHLPDENLDLLSQLTHGLSGAEICACVREVKMRELRATLNSELSPPETVEVFKNFRSRISPEQIRFYEDWAA